MFVRLDGCIAKDLLRMALRTDAHILLAQGAHVRIDIGMLLLISYQPRNTRSGMAIFTYQLLSQRDLLQLQLVHASRGATQAQAGRDERCRPHDC